jgi:membrane fusion protein (multidrug efflux system)
MTPLRFLLLLLIISGAALLAGCGQSASGEADPPAAPAGEAPVAAEAPATNVSVRTAATGRLVETITLTGALEPWQEVTVSSEIGGSVESLGFEKGDRVEKGHVLARVNAEVAAIMLEEAEARLLGAEAEYDKARELVQREAVPRIELTTATARYREALAGVEQAKIRLDRAILDAPITGVCVDRPVELGEVIPPGSRITTLQVQDRLKAVVGLPESLVPLFHKGGEASIEVDAYPDRDFRGRIVYVAPTAAPVDRTFRLEAEVLEEPRRLRPGMVTRVRLTKKVFEEALVVPEDVLVERIDGVVLFVVEGDRARMRRPTVLARAEGRAAIGSGLEAGEQVVVSGQWDLADEALVRIVPE